MSWVVNDWPYIAMLLLAFGGISWATFADTPAVAYWAFLSPVFAVICIAEGWRRFATREERLRLICTQALHWGAVLVAMYLSLLPVVGAVVSENATGLALLTILALGTFLSGLQTRVWQVCVVGAYLAVSVPVIAWLDQSALFLALMAALLLVVAGALIGWAVER